MKMMISIENFESLIGGAYLILVKDLYQFSFSLDHMGRWKGLTAILSFCNDSLVAQVFSLITFLFFQVNETSISKCQLQLVLQKLEYPPFHTLSDTFPLRIIISYNVRKELQKRQQGSAKFRFLFCFQSETCIH